MGKIRDFLFGKQELPKPAAVGIPHEVKHNVSNASGRVVQAKHIGHHTPKHSHTETVRPVYDPAKAQRRREQEEADDRRRKQREADDSSSGILGAIVAAEIITSALDSTPSTDYSSSTSSDSGFSGFGGGESGGGGASGSW